MRSLRSRLWLLWLLASACAVAVGVVLVQLYAASSAAEIGQAEAEVARACDVIRDRFGFYVTGWNGEDSAPDAPDFARQLRPVVASALASWPGVEGGIWSQDAGSLAFVSPAQAAANPALNPAVLPAIRDANQAAYLGEQMVVRRTDTADQVALLASCPLAGPFPGMTAWTRLLVARASGYDRLRAGIGVLLALVLFIGAWLIRMMLVWGRHLRRLETALARHDLAVLPMLPPTGERELDRIVSALNEAAGRVAAAQHRAEAMGASLAAASRLAALGRVAAGVAHEIRNPIAAMRLRAENALAGDPARLRPALEATLTQVARLDRLSTELLTLTQQRQTHTVETELCDFLAARAEEHRDLADRGGVALRVDCDASRAWFDPDLIGQVLNNLLTNAIRHTSSGGTVRITAHLQGGVARISIADDGPGVDPALRDSLFEPFVSGRPEGTGLGLAIARELAEAHGARLVLEDAGGAGRGATFTLELRVAGPETAWQPS